MNNVIEDYLIADLLEQLDDRARDFDPYDYGLPVDSDSKNLTKIVSEWLSNLVSNGTLEVKK